MLLTRTGLGILAGALMVFACGGSDDGADGQKGSGGSGGGAGGTTTASQCFSDIQDGPVKIDYDQYKPVIGKSCSGTNHQDIKGVEQIVYLGDSITNGDVISPKYNATLTPKLMELFPGATLKDCSKGGARNDDFLMGGNQIPQCFPEGTDNLKTLIVMTMGGNDIASYAKDHMPVDQALAEAEVMLGQIREAVAWLKDPAHFPNGSFVVFANVYEFTDTSGVMDSCSFASIAGFNGTWSEGAAVLSHINEQYMKLAVDTRSDMIFMAETFCGHGFKKDDPSLQCYRGPNTPVYFDATCIHPNADGATAIANLFFDVVSE